MGEEEVMLNESSWPSLEKPDLLKGIGGFSVLILFDYCAFRYISRQIYHRWLISLIIGAAYNPNSITRFINLLFSYLNPTL